MRQPGDRIGRYVIVGMLGRGGMGDVYEAEDSLLGRRVALKLIPTGSDKEMRERMLREARTAAGFQHPNVVLVFDAGVVDDGPDAGETFLAMELVRGKTLRSMVRDKEVGLGRKLRWLIDVARALDAAHATELIHRDIKPDNLMVKDDGGIKVLDFGIAKKRSTVDPSAPTGVSPDPLTLTKAGSIVGTPRYASPEQLRGEALDGGADQYSWGVTAYELISGRAPFETDDPVALLSRVLSAEPPKLRDIDSSIPEVVETTILRTMAKRREDRFPRLEDAAALLEPFADAPVASGERRSILSEAPVRTPSPSVAGIVGRKKNTGRAYFLLAAGAVVILALALALGARRTVRTGPVASGSADRANAETARRPLRCSDARISGAGSTPELAHMIGIGACARLGVNIGVPWTHEKATDENVAAERRPVDVEVKLGPTSSVTLTLDQEHGTAESTSPYEAMQNAVAALAARVPIAPMTPAERADWGATTDESARRIERYWRRLLMGDFQAPEAEAKALVKSDPDSPWPHALLALVAVRGSKTSLDAVGALNARLDRVSGARQRGLHALALILEKFDPDEPMRELRKAYGEAPDDADMAGLYAAFATSADASDEGFSVVDRLAEKFPTHALLALTNALSAPPRQDLDRDNRYLTRLIEVLPEARCNESRVDYSLSKDDVPGARATLAECWSFLGTGKAARERVLDLTGAEIDLFAGDFDAALAAGKKRMGDPRSSVRIGAAELVIGAYLGGGQIASGEQTLKGEFARQRDEDSPRVAMEHALGILRIHRRLGTKPPADIVTWLTTTGQEMKALSPASKTGLEIALVMARGETGKADHLLKRIEALDDPVDDLLSVPLLRSRKNDKGVVEILRRRQQLAPDSMMRSIAIDAALSLEATHAEPTEIRAVLRFLRSPNAIGGVTSFDATIAEAILARVAEAEGKADEAATHRQNLAKRLAKADKGVAEIITKLR